MYMLMLLDIAIIGGVNLRSNFSPGVLVFMIKINETKKFYAKRLLRYGLKSLSCPMVVSS